MPTDISSVMYPNLSKSPPQPKVTSSGAFTKFQLVAMIFCQEHRSHLSYCTMSNKSEKFLPAPLKSIHNLNILYLPTATKLSSLAPSLAIAFHLSPSSFQPSQLEPSFHMTAKVQHSLCCAPLLPYPTNSDGCWVLASGFLVNHHTCRFYLYSCSRTYILDDPTKQNSLMLVTYMANSCLCTF